MPASSPKEEFDFLTVPFSHRLTQCWIVKTPSQLCSLRLRPPEKMLHRYSSWDYRDAGWSGSSAADGLLLLLFPSLSLFQLGRWGEINSSTHSVGRQMNGAEWRGISPGCLHTNGSGHTFWTGQIVFGRIIFFTLYIRFCNEIISSEFADLLWIFTVQIHTM